MLTNIFVIIGILSIGLLFTNIHAQENSTITLLNHHIQKNDTENKFIGQVQNNLNDITSFIEINATFYNLNNTIIGNNSTYTEPRDLLPKMKSSFEMTINNIVDDIASYDLEITWNGAGSGINIMKNLK